MTRTRSRNRKIGGTLAGLALGFASLSGTSSADRTAPSTFAPAYFVSASGNDANPGTAAAPFATLDRARLALRTYKRPPVTGPIVVQVAEGTYRLDRTLVFAPEDSGIETANVLFLAEPPGKVTLSGSRKIEGSWKPYKDGILMCELTAAMRGGAPFTQLFVNGRRQTLARFPNRDDAKPGRSGYVLPAGKIPDGLRDPKPGPDDDMTFSGGAPRGVLFNPAAFTPRRWARPEEAVIHIYQGWGWGNMQWRLKAVDYDAKALWFGEGGFQMGAKWFEDPAKIEEESRFFVENVFEELDAPGEWYLDARAGVLYYMPEAGADMGRALVEAPVLETLVRFAGTQDRPVERIALEGFKFTQTASTFLSDYDVPSLSDWAIHRGGAVFLEGTRSCSVWRCWFDAVGGNAVFINNYNRKTEVAGCKFTETGDSAVCVVGTLGATNGTRRAFPYECSVSNNLIHDCGVFGKQIAGVYISRAKRIRAAHNTIFNMPRAGICIGDGTWGGHVIEFNLIHDTCRETGDHGPFNAWGREKFWSLTQSHGAYSKARSLEAGDVRIDAMEPVIVRNNFFEERSGWGLDMDDGASNYEITNNISKGISIKLREGAYRTVHNNIWVESVVAPCFHVGNEDNHDRYFNNITVMAKDDVYSFIAPPARGPWLEEIDRNCLFSASGKFTARISQIRGENGPERGARRVDLEGWRALGFDRNSVFADPMFVDPSKNDYRVKPESPALKVGFKNFEMGTWGIQDHFPSWLR
jgi:hypothetical protein